MFSHVPNIYSKKRFFLFRHYVNNYNILSLTSGPYRCEPGAACGSKFTYILGFMTYACNGCTRRLPWNRWARGTKERLIDRLVHCMESNYIVY